MIKVNWRYFIRNLAMGVSGFLFFVILAIIWFIEWSMFGFILMIAEGLLFILMYANPYEEES